MTYDVECLECPPSPTAIKTAIRAFLLANKSARITSISQCSVTDDANVTKVLVTIIYES